MLINPAELHILIHTTTGGTGKIYRNHYVAPPGTDSLPIIEKLIGSGLMKKNSFTENTYMVTSEGMKIVEGALHHE